MDSSSFSDSEILLDAARGATGVTDFNKQYIKVLIITTNKNIPSGTYETTNASGEKVYSGFPYTIWKRIKENLSDNYEFKEEFKNVLNYGKVIDEVNQNDTYDLVIGLFYRTSKRLDKINYTSPVILSQNSILTFDRINYGERILITMKELLLGPMIILFILSIICGFAIFMIEPNRSEYIDQVKSSRFKVSKSNLSLRRSIMTAIAAFFGEMGFLAENTTLSYKGLFIVVVIMMLAFLFVLVLQAQATTFDAELQQRGTMTRKNLSDKQLLCIKGQSTAKKFERFGANITYIKDKNLSELIEYYKENQDRFNGITVDSMTGVSYKTSKLKLESDEFGLQMTSFIVSKKKIKLLNDMNKEILRLQDSLEQEKICRGFFPGNDNSYLCNS
jgi:hypothetical protein